MDPKHIKELFEINHSGRTLQVWRGGDGHRKQYIGAINGTICAIGPASRFARKTYKFSKKYENHVHSLSVLFMYYNFVKPHAGFGKSERHLTPAIKAGLTTKVWSFDDLLDEVDRYWERKQIRAKLQLAPSAAYTPLPAGVTSDRPYFVMYSPKKREAKVHKGTCGMCRKGAGRREKRSGTNQWYAFQTESGARRCAETLAPTQHSGCSICIVGHYAGNIATGRGI